MFGSQEEATPRSHNRLLEGQIFEGRFQILSVLGEGGVGVVYKAKHLHMDKLVAIKTLMSSMIADDKSLLRFQQEARAASTLTHPNIITIHDFGRSSDGLAYLVMEYLGSKTLDDLMKSEGKLDIDKFLRIFVQICDGLQHAHKKGIVHRDMKPSNVMLVNDEDASNLVKIVDFGLAKLTASADAGQHLTQTGAILGTPLYMSPEQCRGVQLDQRSDIYSVGCMMYAALSGKVPHQGETALNTLMKQMMEPPAPFAVSAPGLVLPPPLESVIFKALLKDPDQRQQSMTELRNDINNAIYFRYPQISAATVEASATRTSEAPLDLTVSTESRAVLDHPSATMPPGRSGSAAPRTAAEDLNANPIHSVRPAGLRSMRSVGTTNGDQQEFSLRRIVVICVSVTAAFMLLVLAPIVWFSSRQAPTVPSTTQVVDNSLVHPAQAVPSTAGSDAAKARIAAVPPTSAVTPSTVPKPPTVVTQSVMPPKVVQPNSVVVPPQKITPKETLATLAAAHLKKSRLVQPVANVSQPKMTLIPKEPPIVPANVYQAPTNESDARRLADSLFAQHNYSQAAKYFWQCRRFQIDTHHGVTPSVFVYDARIVDSLFRQNRDFTMPLKDACKIYDSGGDDGKRLKDVVSTRGGSAYKVWRPLAQASFELSKHQTGMATYLAWALVFSHLSLESWKGPKTTNEFREMVAINSSAAEQVRAQTSARHPAQTTSPKPRSKGPSRRVVRHGKMVITNYR